MTSLALQFCGLYKLQAGAALFIALVLLLLMSLLAVAGMRAAVVELAMAGNVQAQQHAFQAAENAIEVAIARQAFDASAPTSLHLTFENAEVDASVTFIQATGVPDSAFSLGVGMPDALRALHFEVIAVGRGPRGASSTHRQGFYVIGPGEP